MLICVCAPDNELTLLRMKCLISMKRSPDMSPDSKGEMNHEATGEEEEESVPSAERNNGEHVPHVCLTYSARTVQTSTSCKYDLGTVQRFVKF